MARKTVFALVLALLVVAAAELLAFVALWIVDGAPFSPATSAERRRGIRAQAEAPPGGGEDEAGAGSSSEVLHPFLGYVRKPAAEPDAFGRVVTAEGFLARARRSPVPENAFVVGVFGGSVANNLALGGGRAMARELAASPAIAGRPVVIESYAMGGYKQPQQLMALAYLLANGQAPDVAVNLDGFNDVVLAKVDNFEIGVAPGYPRRWDRRVGGLASVEEMRLVGEIVLLRRRRAGRAGLCAGALAWSPGCTLAWRGIDRVYEQRLGELQRELAVFDDAGRSFSTHGPEQLAPDASDDEVYAAIVELWRRSSLAMQRLAAGSGIPYFHFLQPNQYLPGSKPMGRAEFRRAIRRRSPARPVVVESYPRLIAAGERLRTDGVAFYDLTQLFAEVEEPVYIDTCCHLNARGNLLLGQRIGRAIRRTLEDDLES